MRRRHHLLMFCLMAFVSLFATQAASATSPPLGTTPGPEAPARPATSSPGSATPGALVAAGDAAMTPRAANKECKEVLGFSCDEKGDTKGDTSTKPVNGKCPAGQSVVLGFCKAKAAAPKEAETEDQCTGLNNVNPICQAKEEATNAAKGAGESAMKSIATSFASASAFMIDKISGDMAQSADPAFSGKNGAWFNKQYGTMFSLALIVMTLLAFISFGGAAIRGDQSAMVSTIGYMIVACILTASATAIVTLALQFTDAFTDVVAKDFKKNTADMFTNISATYTDTAKGQGIAIGKLIIAMVLSLVTIIGSLIVFVILLLRGALLYGVVLFLPFLFASMVWGGSRSMVATGIKWMTMLILCKFVMFALLAAGAGAMSSVVSPPAKPVAASATPAAKAKAAEAADDSALATMVFGAGAIFLAAFSPILLMSVLPIGAQSGAASAIASGKSAVGKGAGLAVGGVKGSMASAQRAGGAISGGVSSRFGGGGVGRPSGAGASRPGPSSGGGGASSSSATGGLASPVATAARAGMSAGGAAAGSAAAGYAASASAPASAAAAGTGAAISAAVASGAGSRSTASAPTSAPHVIGGSGSSPSASGGVQSIPGSALPSGATRVAAGAASDQGTSPAVDAALAARAGTVGGAPASATPVRGVQANRNLTMSSNRINGSNVIKGV